MLLLLLPAADIYGTCYRLSKSSKYLSRVFLGPSFLNMFTPLNIFERNYRNKDTLCSNKSAMKNPNTSTEIFFLRILNLYKVLQILTYESHFLIKTKTKLLCNQQNNDLTYQEIILEYLDETRVCDIMLNYKQLSECFYFSTDLEPILNLSYGASGCD